jgi:hypothetical protein
MAFQSGKRDSKPLGLGVLALGKPHDGYLNRKNKITLFADKPDLMTSKLSNHSDSNGNTNNH